MSVYRTKKMEEWAGNYGKEYTDRNATTLEEVEALYKKENGITRTEMNFKFLGELDRNMKVLEVGSNIGNQPLCL